MPSGLVLPEAAGHQTPALLLMPPVIASFAPAYMAKAGRGMTGDGALNELDDVLDGCPCGGHVGEPPELIVLRVHLHQLG